jgi:hypothetical protein
MYRPGREVRSFHVLSMVLVLERKKKSIRRVFTSILARDGSMSWKERQEMGIIYQRHSQGERKP